MPYADQHCRVCGDFVKANNMNRHMRRWHSDRVDDDSTDSSNVTKVMTTRMSRSRSPHSPQKMTGKSINKPSEEYIRNAVLCMLRRLENVNIPSLSTYLKRHFSDIPESWRMPIIISAFTAAQKVAATHGDAMVDNDDARGSLAKKALVRWTHGLSAIEPHYHADLSDSSQHSRDSSTSSTNRDAYSPVSNFLLDRELPVPFNSSFDQAEIQREVDERMEVEVSQPNLQPQGDRDRSFVEPPFESNQVNDVLVSVALASVTTPAVNTSMPEIVPVKITSDKSDGVGNVANSGELLAESCQNQLMTTADCSVPDVGVARLSSPVTFTDLLFVPGADEELLTRPLSICLTPLHTPNHIQSDSDECGAVQLHPSPCPSLEKTPVRTTTEERAAMKVPLSTEVSERAPLMRVKVFKSSEVNNGDIVPTDQSKVEVESNVRGGDDAELEDGDQSRRSDTESNVSNIPKRGETKKRDDDKSSKPMRGERSGEQRRHDKENVKKSSHDNERHRSSPKRPKYPSSMIVDKPQRKELAADANGETGFKIPLKPNRDTKHDRVMISPLASSSRDDYSHHHRERSGADRRPLSTVNRHDSDRRPPSDTIRRWNPSNRVDNRGLTREQQRWLERMPQHW